MYRQMKDTINFKMFTLSTDSSAVSTILGISVEQLFQKAYDFIADIDSDYPHVSSWYFNTVVPQVKLGNGVRDILLIVFDDGGIYSLAGLAITKKTQEERKLCTLKIGESFRKIGMASLIFNKVFSILETRKPEFTLSEDHFDAFQSIIKKFDFVVTDCISDLYQVGKKEYIINGKTALKSE